MNEKEAELIGMHIGDGTLYLSGKTLVWEMRGSVDEKDYYEHVAKLIKDILEVEVNPKYRGPNSYGIQTTNKVITKFFTDNGFSPGKKVYTVAIPDYIKLGDDLIKKACVRGLFDTDGCLRFDKNRTKVSYYPRIEFSFASQNLTNSLFELLQDLGFRAYRWKYMSKDREYYSLCLAGFANLDKWIKEVNPANSKHTRRLSEGLANKDKVNLKNRCTNL